MRFASLSSALGLALIAACGGSSSSTPDAPPAAADANPNGPVNEGFTTPTAVTHAWVKENGAFVDKGDADWGCLNTPTADVALAAPVSLTGKITDFQDMSKGVANAKISFFAGIDYATPIASVTAAADGTYTGVTIPAGSKRIGYKITATAYKDTFLLNQYYTAASTTQNISAISEGLATALPAFVGFDRMPGTGVLAGAMRDCKGQEVANAIATVSSVSLMHKHLTNGTAVARTFYFSAAAGLPVKPNMSAHTGYATDKDGLFAVFDLPPQTATAFVQVWGFRTSAELAQGEAGLTLLAELPAPVISETVITGSIEPLRTN
ncbi:MAG: hypothetical protein K8W52_01950 [Deltaproteobacteria bacterium]|nr:hypothetical protein [Deltaproteobacteria bacterium]